MAVKKSQLVKAAKEFNELMGLDPEIDVELDEEDLKEAVLEASELLEPGDELTAGTRKVIEALTTGEEDDGAEDEEETDEGETEEEDSPEDGDDDAEDGDDQEAKAKAKTERRPAAKKAPRDHSRSNKAIVYLAWKDGTTDVDELLDLVEHRVKAATIRSWMNQWKRGANLPAIAKAEESE